MLLYLAFLQIVGIYQKNTLQLVNLVVRYHEISTAQVEGQFAVGSRLLEHPAIDICIDYFSVQYFCSYLQSRFNRLFRHGNPAKWTQEYTKFLTDNSTGINLKRHKFTYIEGLSLLLLLLLLLIIIIIIIIIPVGSSAYFNQGLSRPIFFLDVLENFFQ